MIQIIYLLTLLISHIILMSVIISVKRVIYLANDEEAEIHIKAFNMFRYGGFFDLGRPAWLWESKMIFTSLKLTLHLRGMEL